MALVVKDRVKETTTTTGTGSYTLAGAASGFQSFADALADGDTTWYGVEDGTYWEVGLGTWDESAGTLARTTVYASSNSGSAVNWGAGSKNVFMTLPASRKSTLTVYPTINDLPLTGDVLEGDQAYVSGNNRLYLYNGSGWYNIALVNTTPTVSGNNASYDLASDGTATTVTMTGTDAEGIPITWSATTSGDTNAATVTNSANVFTITPSTNTAHAGTIVVTFKASDGVNIGSSSSDFVLVFSSPYWKNVALGVGTSSTNSLANKTFIDRSSNAHSITATGDATQTAFHPYLDNWSVEFDGNGDDLTMPDGSALGFGTNDFTIEFWYYVSVLANQQTMLDGRSAGSNGAYPLITHVDGVIKYYANAAFQITGTTTISSNTWYHIAVSRSSGSTKLFLNGSQEGSTYADNTNYTSAASTVYIGSNHGDGTPLNGYISNARVVNGTAVYTSAFTPPTEKLTAITNTSLLTCQSNSFVDNSTNAHTITANGDAKVSAFNPFGQESEYAVGENKGSVLFDATSGLTAPQISFGTADFTVEGWHFLNSRADLYPVLFSNYNSFAAGAFSLIAGHDGSTTTQYQIAWNGSFPALNAGTIKYNEWVHFAVVRNSGTVTLYINGVSVGSFSGTQTINGVGSAISLSYGGDVPTDTQLDGFISDWTISAGTAKYTANFTPPTSPVGNTNASLYLPMDNAGIFDKTGNSTLTIGGNAETSTTQTKFANTSVRFDGNGDYVSITDMLTFGTNDFTVEGWIYVITGGSNRNIFDARNGSSNSWVIQSTNFEIKIYDEVAGSYIHETTGGFETSSINSWIHIAYCRSGSTSRFFIDGTKIGSDVSNSSNFQNNSLTIGARFSEDQQYFDGYVEDFQILNGVAKYTANFTAPTATQGLINQVVS